MADDHVAVLDAAHVRFRHANLHARQGAEFAAVAAGHGDGFAPDRIGVFQRAQYVRGVAGTADGDHEVARAGEILQLFGENDCGPRHRFIPG